VYGDIAPWTPHFQLLWSPLLLFLVELPRMRREESHGEEVTLACMSKRFKENLHALAHASTYLRKYLGEMMILFGLTTGSYGEPRAATAIDKV